MVKYSIKSRDCLARFLKSNIQFYIIYNKLTLNIKMQVKSKRIINDMLFYHNHEKIRVIPLASAN